MQKADYNRGQFSRKAAQSTPFKCLDRFYITNAQGLRHKVCAIGMDEPHLLSGQFKVYGDLIKKHQDFTVHENLVGLFRVPSSELDRQT